MADNILLNCSILGRDVGRVFGIRISPSGTVDDLKDAIKGKVTTKLAHIDALDLDIWKARDPCKLSTLITDAAHLQLQGPLSSDGIATALGEIVDGANIPGALQLQPMKMLSSYFPAPPVPEMLHLAIQAPHPGEYQPLALSCQCD